MLILILDKQLMLFETHFSSVVQSQVLPYLLKAFVKFYQKCEEKNSIKNMCLRQAMEYAVKRGIIEKNPFSDVKIDTKPFRRPKKKSVYFL